MESLRSHSCRLLARVPAQKYAGACTLSEAPKSPGDSCKAQAVAQDAAARFNGGYAWRGSRSRGRGPKKPHLFPGKGRRGVLITVLGSKRGFLRRRRRG